MIMYFFAGCPNGHPYAVGDVSIWFYKVFLFLKIYDAVGH